MDRHDTPVEHLRHLGIRCIQRVRQHPMVGVEQNVRFNRDSRSLLIFPGTSPTKWIVVVDKLEICNPSGDEVPVLRSEVSIAVVREEYAPQPVAVKQVRHPHMMGYVADHAVTLSNLDPAPFKVRFTVEGEELDKWVVPPCLPLTNAVINSRVVLVSPNGKLQCTALLKFSLAHPLPLLFKIRLAAARMVQTKWFEYTILITIIYSSFLLVSDSVALPHDGASEFVVFSIFVVEFLVKIVGAGFVAVPLSYLRDGWNIVDFVILVVSLLSLVRSGVQVRMFRLLRVLRPLRTVTHLPKLRRLVVTIIRCAPVIMHVISVLLFVMWVFALLGMSMWNDSFYFRCHYPVHDEASGITGIMPVQNDTDLCSSLRECARTTPQQVCRRTNDLIDEYRIFNFNNIGTSLLLVLKVVSLDNWNKEMIDIQNANSWWAWVFFVSLTILSSYICINLFLAVLTSLFVESMKLETHDNNLTPYASSSTSLGGILIMPPASVAFPSLFSVMDSTVPAAPQSGARDSLVHRRVMAHLQKIRENSGFMSYNHLLTLAHASETLEGYQKLAVLPFKEETVHRFTLKFSWSYDNTVPITGVPLVESPVRVALPCHTPGMDTASSYLPCRCTVHLNETISVYSVQPEANVTVADEVFTIGGERGDSGSTEVEIKGVLYVMEWRVEAQHSIPIKKAESLVVVASWVGLPLSHIAARMINPHGKAFALLTDVRWMWVVVAFTVANVITLSVDHYGVDSSTSQGITVVYIVCTAVFALEALVKVAGSTPKAFVKVSFNLFEVLLLAVALLEPLDVLKLRSVSALRALRIIQILKLNARFQSLQPVLVAFFDSLRAVSCLSLLMVIFIFMYAILGTQLFSDHPSYPGYRTIGEAMLSSLVIITGDGWTESMRSAMLLLGDEVCILFISLFVLGNYVLVNLFVSILLDMFGSYEHPEDIPEGENDLPALPPPIPNAPPSHAAEAASYRGDYEEVFIDEHDGVENMEDAEGCGGESEDAKEEEEEDKEEEEDNDRMEEDRNEDIPQDGKVGTVDKADKATAKGGYLSYSTLYFRGRTNPLDSFFRSRQRGNAEWGAELDRGRVGKSLNMLSRNNCVRRAAGKVLSCRYFHPFMMLCVVLNTAVLFVDNPRIHGSVQRFVFTTDAVLAGIFAVEALLHIVVLGLVQLPNAYLRKPWNVFDFVVVLLTLTALYFDSRPMRAFRALRTLRPVRSIPQLQIIITSLGVAIPAIINVAVLCGIVWYVVSIVGVELFKGAYQSCSGDPSLSKAECTGVYNETLYSMTGEYNSERNRTWESADSSFDNVGSAMYTLLKIAVGDGWSDIMWEGLNSKGADKGHASRPNLAKSPYFVVVLVLVQFVAFNLFIGVLFEQINQHAKRLRDKECSHMTERQRAWVTTVCLLEKRAYPSSKIPAPDDRNDVVRVWCYSMVTSRWFDTLITSVVVVNAILMSSFHYQQSSSYTDFLAMINIVFLAVYVLEAIIKITAYGGEPYFRDKWNIFDFSVAALSLASVAFTTSGTTSVRVVKVLRPLRLIKQATVLRALLGTLVLALPALGNVTLLLFIVFFLWGVFGVELWGRIPDTILGTHLNFHNLGYAVVTLYSVATTEGWADFIENCSVQPPLCDDARNECGHSVMAHIYFISFLFVTGFVVINVFVTVIIECFEEAQFYEREKAKGKYVALDRFREMWSKKDERLCLVIPAGTFVHILRLMPSPLWRLPYHRGNTINTKAAHSQFCNTMRQLETLDIPVNDLLQVSYTHCLRALAMRLCGLSLQETYNVMGKWGESGKVFLVKHWYAADFISRRWKHYTNTRYERAIIVRERKRLADLLGLCPPGTKDNPSDGAEGNGMLSNARQLDRADSSPRVLDTIDLEDTLPSSTHASYHLLSSPEDRSSPPRSNHRRAIPTADETVPPPAAAVSPHSCAMAPGREKVKVGEEKVGERTSVSFRDVEGESIKEDKRSPSPKPPIAELGCEQETAVSRVEVRAEPDSVPVKEAKEVIDRGAALPVQQGAETGQTGEEDKISPPAPQVGLGVKDIVPPVNEPSSTAVRGLPHAPPPTSFVPHLPEPPHVTSPMSLVTPLSPPTPRLTASTPSTVVQPDIDLPHHPDHPLSALPPALPHHPDHPLSALPPALPHHPDHPLSALPPALPLTHIAAWTQGGALYSPPASPAPSPPASPAASPAHHRKLLCKYPDCAAEFTTVQDLAAHVSSVHRKPSTPRAHDTSPHPSLSFLSPLSGPSSAPDLSSPLRGKHSSQPSARDRPPRPAPSGFGDGVMHWNPNQESVRVLSPNEAPRVSRDQSLFTLGALRSKNTRQVDEVSDAGSMESSFNLSGPYRYSDGRYHPATHGPYAKALRLRGR